MEDGCGFPLSFCSSRFFPSGFFFFSFSLLFFVSFLLSMSFFPFSKLAAEGVARRPGCLLRGSKSFFSFHFLEGGRYFSSLSSQRVAPLFFRPLWLRTCCGRSMNKTCLFSLTVCPFFCMAVYGFLPPLRCSFLFFSSPKIVSPKMVAASAPPRLSSIEVCVPIYFFFSFLMFRPQRPFC